MTDLEWSIRDTAKELAGLFRELDAAKYTRPKPPEVRSMRPAPGPRPPAPDHLVSLDEELTSRLFEMTRECANHIRPTLILTKNGMRLCSFLAFNAQAVSELDVAPDLLDELKDQVRTLKRKLQPQGVQSVANTDPYLTADSIQRSLTNKGLSCPPATIRSWAQRGHVATKQRKDGHTAYRLADIIDRLKATK